MGKPRVFSVPLNLEERAAEPCRSAKCMLALRQPQSSSQEPSMWIVLILASLFLILLVLVDSFEAIVLPRRVTHRFRFGRLFYRSSWSVWRSIALQISAGKRREAFLGVFGPLSL